MLVGGWDVVRAFGYEVVEAWSMQADAHIADPEPVVLVNAAWQAAWPVLRPIMGTAALMIPG